MKNDEISSLVDEASSIESEILPMVPKIERLKEIKKLLAAEGEARPEEHETGKKGGKLWIADSATNRATVTFPAAAIKPSEDAIEASRKIAGVAFGKLFDRDVVYSPVKAFRDVAEKLLAPAKVKKLISLCEVPTAPRVTFEILPAK